MADRVAPRSPSCLLECGSGCKCSGSRFFNPGTERISTMLGSLGFGATFHLRKIPAGARPIGRCAYSERKRRDEMGITPFKKLIAYGMRGASSAYIVSLEATVWRWRHA